MKKIYILAFVLLIALGITFGASAKNEAPMVNGNGPPDQCTKIQDGTLLTSAGDVIETGYDEWGYNYQEHMFNGFYCDAYRDAAWCQPYKDVELMMKWNNAWIANEDCDGDNLLDRHDGYDSYIDSGAWLTNHQAAAYWDLLGEWDAVFIRDDGTPFPHAIEVLSQTDGEFSGIGASGAHLYTFLGEIDEDEISILATYSSTLPGYTYTASGSIEADGSISGTWVGSNGRYGTWYTTSGNAPFCEWNYFVKIVAAPADATKSGGFWNAADGTEIGAVIWGEFAVIQEVYNDSCTGESGPLYVSPDHAGFGGW